MSESDFDKAIKKGLAFNPKVYDRKKGNKKPKLSDAEKKKSLAKIFEQHIKPPDNGS